MKKKLFILVGLLMTVCANAQLSRSESVQLHTQVQEYDVVRSKNYHRIYLGYLNRWIDMSKRRFDDENVVPSQSISGLGASIGWTVGMPVSKTLPLYIETGFRFGQAFGDKEGDKNGYEYYTDMESYFLSVPVNITYRYKIGERMFVAPYAGFYLGGYVHEKIGLDVSEWEFGQYDAIPDFGMQLGVNLDLKWFHLGVNWQPSFLNYGMKCSDDGHYDCHDKLDGFNHKFNVNIGFVIQKKKKVRRN